MKSFSQNEVAAQINSWRARCHMWSLVGPSNRLSSGSQPSQSEWFFQLSSISIDQKSRQFIIYEGKIETDNIN